MQDEKKEFQPFSLLIAVYERKNGNKIAGLFKNQKALVNLMMLGKGTANSKILNYLGLGQSEKSVHLSVMQEAEAHDLLHNINLTLDLKEPGQGIAFTLPLNGACAKSFITTRHIEERKEEKMNNQPEYELIITVANRGYSEEVMDAARSARATGGTILNARGFSLTSVEKFFEVTLQDEKEVVMILAQSDRKINIMNEIAEKAGPNTQAGAVSFSLAVSDVEGLQPYLGLM